MQIRRQLAHDKVEITPQAAAGILAELIRAQPMNDDGKERRSVPRVLNYKSTHGLPQGAIYVGRAMPRSPVSLLRPGLPCRLRSCQPSPGQMLPDYRA